MTLRLKSRLVSGLIVSTIGMTGATFANAADKPPTTVDTTPAATTTGRPHSAPATGSPSSAPTTGTTAETSRPPSAAPGGDAADSPAKKLFDQLDLNRDGTLSLEEFSRATFQQPAK